MTSPLSSLEDHAPRPAAPTRRGAQRHMWLERAWSYRHPALLPVLFMWFAIALGIADYVRAYTPLPRGLFTSNDWLINYEGGFVRRGLPGELLYGFHEALHLGALTMDLLVFQMGLYVGLGVVMSLLAWRCPDRLLPWVLLSPAALLFSSYNTIGGFREELLFCLALGLVALAARSGTPRAASVLCGAGGFLFVLFVLSWEAGILLLPVLLLCLARALRHHPPVAARRLAMLTSTASVIAFALEVANPGNPAVVARICTSLARAGVPYSVDCTASGKGIDGLASLAESWHDTVREVAGNWPGYWPFFVLFAVALIPFVASGWASTQRRFVLVAIVCVAPLFVIGTDYGRWIHLSIMSITFFWFMTTTREDADARPRGALELVALTAWVTCWSLNFWRDPLLIGGFWNVLDQTGLLHLFHQYPPAFSFAG